MKDERDKMFIEMKNLQREYQALNASFKHFAEHVFILSKEKLNFILLII